MSGFQKSPIEGGFLSIEGHTVGVWVNQSDASHVALSYAFPKKDGEGFGVYDCHFIGRFLNEEIDWAACKKQRLAHTVELDDFSKNSFPGFLNKVIANSNVHFGINWLGNLGTINPMTGVYTPPADRPGFTCATFLDTVFRAVGLEVVAIDDWPKNDADALRWRDDFANKLEQGGKTPPDVVEDIRKTNPVIRLWPSEFAAAVAQGVEAWPVSKQSALELAQRVIEDFNKTYPRR